MRRIVVDLYVTDQPPNYLGIRPVDYNETCDLWNWSMRVIRVRATNKKIRKSPHLDRHAASRPHMRHRTGAVPFCQSEAIPDRQDRRSSRYDSDRDGVVQNSTTVTVEHVVFRRGVPLQSYRDVHFDHVRHEDSVRLGRTETASHSVP